MNEENLKNIISSSASITEQEEGINSNFKTEASNAKATETEKTLKVSKGLESALLNGGEETIPDLMESLALSHEDYERETDKIKPDDKGILFEYSDDSNWSNSPGNNELTDMQNEIFHNRQMSEIAQNPTMVDFLEDNPVIKDLAFAIREMTYQQILEVLGIKRWIKEEQEENKPGLLEILIRFLALSLELLANSFEEIKERDEIPEIAA